jgi:5'(3')-deoxyribonucleotidase
MLTIGIDVDLTLVATDVLWEKWLRDNGAILDPWWLETFAPVEKPYDVSKMFILPDGLDPYAFWRSKTLYDGLDFLSGAKEVIHYWHVCGHKIVFVSAIKGDHHKSKYYLLAENFPYNSGVVFTKEKGLVKLDVMIDDRDDILNQFDGTKTLKIKFHTPYEQKEPSTAHFTIKDWKDERLKNL